MMEPKGFTLLSSSKDFDGHELPRFKARFPWFGAHLQTARNNMVHPPGPGPGWRRKDLVVPLREAALGKLTARLEIPQTDRPVGAILMLHGLGGKIDSTYTRLAARFFLGQGYRVVRLNMRGADTSAQYCDSHYHAGLTSDIEDVIQALPDAVKGQGIYLVGFSLGANIILKLLGEGSPVLDEIRAGLAVSAPLDLSRSLQVIDRPDNWLYRQYLVGKLRQTHRLVGPKWASGRGQLSAIRGIRDYDEAVVAPMHGFRNAADYYAKCSGRKFLPAIKTPLLIVHAANDPWIPATIYRGQDWPQPGSVTAVLTDDGGHMGFHALGSRFPWYLRAAAPFFAQQHDVS
jgi:predicted alpha/beta-fold hydrolase